jgi:alpha-mannosidase
VLAHRLAGGYYNGMMLPGIEAPDRLRQRLEAALRDFREYSALPHLALILNGVDHIWIQRDLPALLAEARRLLPDWTFELASLEPYAATFREAAAVGLELPARSGCLRDKHLRAEHLQGTWSSRIDNKLENARTSAVLEGLAEPVAAIGALLGGIDRRQELALAWQLVLQNSAHDSICGCSVDAVHADVNTRFSHAQQLAEMVAARSLAPWLEPAGDAPLLCFAGLGGATEQVEFLVDLPHDRPMFVLDHAGAPLPTQRFGLRRLRRHDYIAAAPPAPPCSVQRWDLQEGQRGPDQPVMVSDDLLDNGLLRVQVGSDGSLRVTHAPSGYVYEHVFELTDEADLGGGYAFQPLPGDVPLSSRGVIARIEVLERGPVRGRLRVIYDWPLPAALSPAMDARTDERSTCRATWELSLGCGSEVLGVRLVFDNRARDHRVRLRVPTPFDRATVHAERAFVVAREDLMSYEAEAGQDTHPMRNWVSLAGERGGMALVAPGLHEYAVEPSPGGDALAMTLLRAVPYVYICGTWATPDAQLQCPLDYAFHLVFHRGDWRQGAVASTAARLVFPTVVECRPIEADLPFVTQPHATVRYEAEANDGRWLPTPSHRSSWKRHFAERDGWRRLEPRPRMLPQPSRFVPFEVDGRDVLLSALKPAERDPTGGDDRSRDVILRLYSVAVAQQRVTVRAGVELSDAWLADMAESPLEPLDIRDQRVSFLLHPFEIQTIRLRPASKGKNP